ncbi:hypothetical protein [Cupriavidus consociatus]|uniref:hypothetical protein n=1 Tax=Cupriavidus consociatus TaxID=2821357 RepID=UPI001AE76E8F|nr:MULTISPECIES: hypothetical protein [unclassified Cupriavidus]MBP0619422.1 hypothetical protein [Cupriavidus sp. LEh25]MDK2656070.1 hypothetical protein [Cupriavidus sp. LEh21]
MRIELQAFSPTQVSRLLPAFPLVIAATQGKTLVRRRGFERLAVPGQSLVVAPFETVDLYLDGGALQPARCSLGMRLRPGGTPAGVSAGRRAATWRRRSTTGSDCRCTRWHGPAPGGRPLPPRAPRRSCRSGWNSSWPDARAFGKLESGLHRSAIAAHLPRTYTGVVRFSGRFSTPHKDFPRDASGPSQPATDQRYPPPLGHRGP